MNKKFIWVVVRHEIDYKKPALLNDKIQIKTWIVSVKGAKSIRKVVLFKNKILLAKSTSTWCLLDAKSHKATRVTSEIEDLFKN